MKYGVSYMRVISHVVVEAEGARSCAELYQKPIRIKPLTGAASYAGAAVVSRFVSRAQQNAVESTVRISADDLTCSRTDESIS